MALLERAQQGDDDACQQMLLENTGLIWSIVKRYRGCGVETDDLYQLGCIGFIKAVKGFDLTYGTQFSTYAVPKIAGEIRRFLRDDGPIKVGRTLREKGQMLWAAKERLQNRLGCAPRLSELAEETGLTVHAPRLCGIKDWCEEGVRHVVLLYRAEQFTGTLRSSDEGEVWWAELAGLPSLDLASSDMLDLLRVFEEDDLSELFYRQNGEDWTYELK